MTTCRVAGCENPATEIFNLNEAPLMETVVCEQHALELRVSPWRTNEAHEILVGESGPERLVNIKVHTDIGGSTVTMMLGRDGQETQRFTFTMTPQEAIDLCYIVSGAKHDEDHQPFVPEG